MWKSCFKTAAIELAIYTAAAFLYMAIHGSASGVFIPLLPILWLVLAVRLWLGVSFAVGIAEARGITYRWGFLVIAIPLGMATSLVLYPFVGFHWSVCAVSVGAHTYVSLEGFHAWRRREAENAWPSTIRDHAG